MKTDRLLLAECILRKAALFPLFYHLKHLLPYFGITSHDLFFCHAKLSVIIFVSKRWLADGILCERKKPVKKHPGRRALPEHLPVQEVVIEPEEDLTLTGMVQIGQEVTDVLEYKPASFYIIRYIRPKYARKDQEGVAIAKLPERTFDKCVAGNGLLTSIIVDKYMDHLPLYRQLERFKRDKIPISPSIVDGWVKQVGGLLEIPYDHLLKQTRTKGYLQADETPIKVMDRDKKGSCHLGYFWVYRSPVDKTVLFHYQTGRNRVFFHFSLILFCLIIIIVMQNIFESNSPV